MCFFCQSTEVTPVAQGPNQGYDLHDTERRAAIKAASPEMSDEDVGKQIREEWAALRGTNWAASPAVEE